MEFGPVDRDKNAMNLAKHGMELAIGEYIFAGRVLEVMQIKSREIRWKAIGFVEDIALAVVYTHRDHLLRLISVRMANRKERREYEQR